jgi:5-methylcytosine-specific restriction protein A
MSRRRHLTRLMRTRIFDSTKGVCCICHTKIDAERGAKWIVEHEKPLWMGGADDETNMGPAHQSCAIAKTVSEAPVKAKGDRIRASHLGIRKPRSIRGWRKFNGDIVTAPRER